MQDSCSFLELHDVALEKLNIAIPKRDEVMCVVLIGFPFATLAAAAG